MSFRTAISGIRASSADLNVIGNNIANVSTTGFKASRAEFADVFAASSTGVSANAVGQGVNTARVAQQFTQGNITFTDNGMDLAISGGGFFILDDNGTQVYSRDGAFGVDREGYVVNSSGQRLMAFSVDANGNVTGALSELQISTANTTPQPTTNIDLGANLDSAESLPTVTTFDPADTSSFNHTTATTIYDSLGGAHLMQFFFVKTGTNAWDLHTTVDGTAVGGANAMTFTNTGALSTPASGTITLPSFTPSGGGAAMTPTIDLNEMTQFGVDFTVNNIVQDGFTAGTLASVDIDSQGNVFARYTNGQAAVQGQVALATFANPQGLRALGQNTWAATFEAGDAVINAPGSSSVGNVQAGALEDSNIDLSEELVKLIVAQRNFQANTEVIQTEDATTQAVINIR